MADSIVTPHKDIISGRARPLLANSGPVTVLSKASSNGKAARPKQQNCQILRFGLRMADSILPGVMSLSAARRRKLLFYQALAERMAALSTPASRTGRFIKADGRFIKAGKPQLQFYQASGPFYQPEAAKWPDPLDLSHGPYDPTQRNSQRPGQATSGRKRPNGRFIKASSDGRFIKASPNGHFIKDRRMASLSRPVASLASFLLFIEKNGVLPGKPLLPFQI